MINSDSSVRLDRRDLLICLALAVLTFAAYYRVTGFGFVNFDDPDYVYENDAVLAGLHGATIKWALTTTEMDSWQPLTWLSYMMEVSTFGVRPRAIHLNNVLLHALSACL